jgi:site-specific DNA recombinase
MRRTGPGSSERSREIRCAIYTRKSSEEGLEQEFNSLHAQRESCLAYIQSQRHEGWRALATQYDDGGISGGTLQRPALARLLDDIRAKRVDLVVIYKVDRLTRSLSDFAKLVEVFDARNVSFVSVTQQFNTASSMGRLTLNMLLSFAQFEREVAGERIRDKIAASKRRGMWMGGNPPLGFDVRDRKLVVNEREATDVREIFRAYLQLGCVRTLMAHLAALGIVTKRRLHADGKRLGGRPLSRGNLYQMLQNPTYRGKVAHKGQVYDGEHDTIISVDLWDQVQAQLAGHRVQRQHADGEMGSLLSGLIFDTAGQRLCPTHSKKGPRRYRYYISQGLITDTRADSGEGMRLPAGEVERLVIGALREMIGSPAKLREMASGLLHDAAQQKQLLRAAAALAAELDHLPASRVAFLTRRTITRIVVQPGQLLIELVPKRLIDLILDRDGPRDSEQIDLGSPTAYQIVVSTSLKRVGKEVRLIVASPSRLSEADPALLRLLAKAQEFKKRLLQADNLDISELAAACGISGAHFTRILRLGFLAPDIVTVMTRGEQPVELTATQLMADTRLPLEWNQQRAAVGFPTTSHSPA